jgi:hypothetical protein
MPVASGVGNGIGDGVVDVFSPDQSAIMDRLRVIMAKSATTTQTRSGRISRPARRVANMHATLPKALKTKKPRVVKVKFAAPPPSLEPRTTMPRVDGMPTLTDSGRLSTPPARLRVVHNPPEKSYGDLPRSSSVGISAAAISAAIAQKPMIGPEPLMPLLPMDIMDVALPDDDAELHNMLDFFDVSNMLEGTAAASTAAAAAAESGYQEQHDGPVAAISERKTQGAIFFL